MRRTEVEWFANHMERKLQENDYKGGWQNDSFIRLMDRLNEESEELGNILDGLNSSNMDIVDATTIIREAADVANFAMMLADKAYKLAYEKRTTETGPQAGDGQAEAGSDQ